MRCILQLSKSNPDDLLRKKRKTFVQNIQKWTCIFLSTKVFLFILFFFLFFY
ncbi:hypothetical protein RUMHYD_03285 [Blautia hydrogenotrophica DSM 10507]|uniref:Uncharacterized protein n=1 Tax=Blautia hydrogenotrophica (strain DSM 10507 / JCM 14656 / S5a33) TaxID=476272 RepID=C0CQX2_BLAHS|nr:hypothetical protein RUMHYD_03285 [Blautia hydrogenotrophica DSM 10507]